MSRYNAVPISIDEAKPKGKEARDLVRLNQDAVLEEMRRIGEGIVDSVGRVSNMDGDEMNDDDDDDESNSEEE
jgi:hypothetical protein